MLVLDASVTLAGVLYDQVHGDEARDLLRGIAVSGAVVPALWRLEVGDILLVEQRRNRLAAANAAKIRARLARLPIHIDDQTETNAWGETLTLAFLYRLTLYDATYLEVAIQSWRSRAPRHGRRRPAIHVLSSDPTTRRGWPAFAGHDAVARDRLVHSSVSP